MGKRKGRQRQTEFINLDPKIVEERARNPLLPWPLRKRYLAEAKALRRRNRQKRGGR